MVPKATSFPLVVYNIPGRTASNIEPATQRSLAGIEMIVGVKEASGDIGQIAEVVRQCPSDFAVLSGDDGLTLPILSVGGRGVISVSANAFPRETSRVVDLWLEGKVDEARREHLRLLPVHQSMFLESNPGPVKALLASQGHLAPEVRLPLAWPSEDTLAKVRAICDDAGVRLA